MSATLDAWRDIAHRENGRETVNMSRSTLRLLFDEMDARAGRAEADADRLATAIREAHISKLTGAMCDALSDHDDEDCPL